MQRGPVRVRIPRKGTHHADGRNHDTHFETMVETIACWQQGNHHSRVAQVLVHQEASISSISQQCTDSALSVFTRPDRNRCLFLRVLSDCVQLFATFYTSLTKYLNMSLMHFSIYCDDSAEYPPVSFQGSSDALLSTSK